MRDEGGESGDAEVDALQEIGVCERDSGRVAILKGWLRGRFLEDELQKIERNLRPESDA